MADSPQQVRVSPRLQRAEIEFLRGFGPAAVPRRVWPGQPSARCPWQPSDDGRHLELDDEVAAEDNATVAPWLRFLSRAFLAPSTERALGQALSIGLRGGHRLRGEVHLGRGLVVTVRNNRVLEHLELPGPPAVRGPSPVADLDAVRRAAQSTER